MHFHSLVTTFLLTCAPTTIARSYNKKNDAVKLSSVRSLTLRDGVYTSHRRVDPVPQLKCVGGNAKGLYDVDTMRCTNSGSEYDAEDIQWTCKASLPPEFKLGSTEVYCEGFDSPEDPYILKGSCGVEYRLILTQLGEEKYGRSNNFWGSKPTTGKNSRTSSEGGLGEDIAGYIFWIFFIGVLGVIIYSVIYGGGNNNNNNGQGRGNRRPPRFPFGGGGGGRYNDDDDDNNNPPPPYTPRALPKFSPPRNSNEPWRPGFWSGTAAGAAAAYTAAQWANRNNNRARQQEPLYGQAGPSSWFGGGGRPQSVYETEPSGWFGGGSHRAGSSFGAGPSNSSPPSSSDRYDSVGFGGTRRR